MVPVNVTEHFPDDSVQAYDEDLPLAAPEAFDQVIVPVYGECAW